MRNILYGKKCAKVIAKEPDVFVGLFSLLLQHQYDKEQHKNQSPLQPSKHTLSTQPRYDTFRNMECIHFVLVFGRFCKYSQVFARQNTKRKTRRLDILSVVQQDILDNWFPSRCYSMEPVFQWPSFTKLRYIRYKVLYDTTQEIKDKITALSLVVNLDKFLLQNTYINKRHTWKVELSDILQK